MVLPWNDEPLLGVNVWHLHHVHLQLLYFLGGEGGQQVVQVWVLADLATYTGQAFHLSSGHLVLAFVFGVCPGLERIHGVCFFKGADAASVSKSLDLNSNDKLTIPMC